MSRPPEVFSWDDLPSVLVVKDVRAVLRLSDATVYEAARSGFLKDVVVRVGRQLRFPKEPLRRLLEGGAPGDHPSS